MNGKRKRILKRKLKEIAEIKEVGLLMELKIKKMKRKNFNKRNMKSTLIL
jgi:hypothetical protein